jgi:adenylate cyclase
MGTEIEKKFLVVGDAWRRSEDRLVMKQAYLSTDPARTVRVRLEGDRAELTIKGKAEGAARPEFNYSIPCDDAAVLLTLARGHAVEKIRYRVRVADFVWEVDEFSGQNAGLVIAEVEAESEGALQEAAATRPSWVGRDVSDDSRLYNAALAERPFATWSEAERRALTDASATQAR